MGDNSNTLVELLGDDYLDGEEGDDLLNGAGGSDTLLGGSGNDQLWGMIPMRRPTSRVMTT